MHAPSDHAGDPQPPGRAGTPEAGRTWRNPQEPGTMWTFIKSIGTEAASSGLTPHAVLRYKYRDSGSPPVGLVRAEKEEKVKKPTFKASKHRPQRDGRLPQIKKNEKRFEVIFNLYHKILI